MQSEYCYIGSDKVGKALALSNYRYNPEQGNVPSMCEYEVEEAYRNAMVLDVLEHLKTRDPTLIFQPRYLNQGTRYPLPELSSTD